MESKYLSKLFLERLIAALDIPLKQLKQNGDSWIIKGRHGAIKADSFSCSAFIECRSKRAWSATKAKLAFMSLLDDFRQAGRLSLDRMPTEAEAPVIRKAIGLKKRPCLSDEYKSSLRERLSRKPSKSQNESTASHEQVGFGTTKSGLSEKQVQQPSVSGKAHRLWETDEIDRTAEIPQIPWEILVLERRKFIGKVSPWKGDKDKTIIALLVPVETALEEIRYSTHQPDMTRAEFVDLLESNGIAIFSSVDHFCKLKDASRNIDIIQQTRRNAKATHSIFAS